MKPRLLLLLVGLGVALPSESIAATRLPGLRPSDLSTLAIYPSDIRTLNAAVTLEAEELLRAHDAMKRYRLAVQEGSRDVLAAMTGMEPVGAWAAFQHEKERETMVEQVRERIEARRQSGEFRDDPAALREAWQEAMDEAQRDVDRAHRDTANVDGWSEAFQKQAAVLARWYETKDGLSDTLQTDLLAIVTTEQSPEVSRWWLRARLEAAMKRGRLSGEQHDPFAADFPQSDARDLAFETWIERHIELIDARDAGLRRIPVVAAGAIGRGNIRRFRDAVYEAMADREAVRDHAGEGVEILAVLLDNAAAEAFLKSSSKKAFPGIWQVDRAMRALTAALQASTLDTTQQGLLSALRLEHTQLSGELRTRHLDAVRAEEGRRLADQDVQRAAVLFGDEVFIPRPTPMLDASAGERRQLSDDSMARLRGILTDEQWQLVPGTRSVPERE